ncbi:MAG: cytochrome b5 domain-containing protein, partial [Actinobacteria bacterium]|nr:cytochrome b5 domain-containing protein [Actinomycetota bacterium]
MRALTETAIFDTAFGLPLHSLVVHAAVVLVPLAAIGAVVMAFSPRFSRRFGALVVVVAIVGFGSSFIAKESGEALARRVGLPAEHAQLGDLMPVFALLL